MVIGSVKVRSDTVDTLGAFQNFLQNAYARRNAVRFHGPRISSALTLPLLRVSGIFSRLGRGDSCSLIRGSCKQQRHGRKRESQWFAQGDCEQISLPERTKNSRGLPVMTSW